jgi:cytochrome c oxidase subunit II
MKIKFLVSMIAIITFATTTLYFSQHSHAEDAPRRIEIVAKRWDYTPGQVTLKKGVPVVIVLTSQDANHGLKFKELNVKVEAKKGQTSELAFTPTQAGTFTGQCSVFCGKGHGSMDLVLHVTE